MREGRSPSGAAYYPAFPYASYTRMGEDDLRALKAYLDTVPPVRRPSRPHELSFPYSAALGHALVAMGVLRARPLPARSGPRRRLEPRGLPGAGSRPLRRGPHAPRQPRRARYRPGRSRVPCSARRGYPTSPAARRALALGARAMLSGLKLGMLPVCGFRRLGDGEGCQQQYQQAPRRRSCRHGELSGRACPRSRGPPVQETRPRPGGLMNQVRAPAGAARRCPHLARRLHPGSDRRGRGKAGDLRLGRALHQHCARPYPCDQLVPSLEGAAGPRRRPGRRRPATDHVRLPTARYPSAPAGLLNGQPVQKAPNEILRTYGSMLPGNKPGTSERLMSRSNHRAARVRHDCSCSGRCWPEG